MLPRGVIALALKSSKAVEDVGQVIRSEMILRHGSQRVDTALQRSEHVSTVLGIARSRLEGIQCILQAVDTLVQCVHLVLHVSIKVAHIILHLLNVIALVVLTRDECTRSGENERPREQKVGKFTFHQILYLN